MQKTDIPVMLKETLQALHLKQNEFVIDATVGLGGHAGEILSKIAPKGRLLGIERTKEGAAAASSNLKKFGKRAIVVSDDFRNIDKIAQKNGFDQVDAILFDLGLASWQIDQGFKGLSFQPDVELDMLLTPASQSNQQIPWTQNVVLAKTVNKWRFHPAKEFINHAKQEEMEIVFKIFGDLGNAQKIAKQIAEYRKDKLINNTQDFKQAVKNDNPKVLAPIFQSLRILVNDEYGALAEGIYGSWNLLKKGGRLAIITFHSGEDRLVKKMLPSLTNSSKMEKFFPSREEVQKNKRARSAVLRKVAKEE